jgi:hypothetical protein
MELGFTDLRIEYKADFQFSNEKICVCFFFSRAKRAAGILGGWHIECANIACD